MSKNNNKKSDTQKDKHGKDHALTNNPYDNQPLLANSTFNYLS